MALLGFGSAGYAGARTAAGPPSNPPGRDPCSHGATGKPCRPDPQPDHGKDCDHHGQNGGADEDHCGPSTTPTTGATGTTTTPTTGTTTTSRTPGTTATTANTATTRTTATTTRRTTTSGTTTVAAATTTSSGTTTLAASVRGATTTTTRNGSTTTAAGRFTPPPQRTTPRRATRTTRTTTSGPFKPPPLPPAKPAQPITGRPPLPFTGAQLTFAALLGVALLLAGWLLRTTGRRHVPAVHTAERSPRKTVWRRRPELPLTPLGEDSEYRVFVPDVGSFASIDAAEQRALDRRWASAGSPTLGAPGAPKATRSCGRASAALPPTLPAPAQRSDESAG